MHPFADYVNPYLADLLAKINMDKLFVRGEDCYLYDSAGNRYLDLIASYGALPFGHNPPEIWDAIQAIHQSGEPNFVQPSYLNAAGELAKRLISLAPTGLSYVTFTNSGAEATEAGIKLCRAATGRLRILAAKNSFHGKTLGALSATGNESYQKAFGAPVEGFDFVPYGDIEAVNDMLSRHGSEYAAFILEPIQGEGGIVVPPPGYLSEVRELCTKHGILLILDEVQSGLGRTGRMFACEEEGIVPDVMLLAKALGGGMMPIGAMLSSENAYTEDFATKHSSTFAGNTFACRAGLAALDMLIKDDSALLKQVKSNGKILKQGLIMLQNRYPHVIRSVRGRGLMLGLEFSIARDTFPGSLIGVMAEQEILTPVISSYLLNTERIRVAPTLNGADVIRIEPPLTITEDQCRDALDGLGRAIEALALGNTACLLNHLVRTGEHPSDYGGNSTWQNDPSPISNLRKDRIKPSEDSAEGRFAFLVHPLTVQNYFEFDESLNVFSESELTDLTTRWNDLVDPFVVSEAKVVSKTGATAFGEFIVVPRTTNDLVNGSHEEVMALLKKAVDMAKNRGAKIVGLGAYTSVVSRGGRYLLGEGTAITTGNSYTVVSAVEALMSSFKRLDIDPAEVTVSVVGATGSIGRATAILLSEELPRLILIGNPKNPEKSKRRLTTVTIGICKHLSAQMRLGRRFKPGSIGEFIRTSFGIPPEHSMDSVYEEMAAQLIEDAKTIVLTMDADNYLPLSDAVVTATNSLADIVTPGNVRFGAVVLDLSRPQNVSKEIQSVRPDVLVIDGGVVALPGRPSLGWNFGFEQGLAYACMAETIMLALDHHYEHMSIGADLDIDRIIYTRNLAQKHGIALADLRSFDRPLSQEEWEKVIASRKTAVGA